MSWNKVNNPRANGWMCDMRLSHAQIIHILNALREQLGRKMGHIPSEADMKNVHVNSQPKNLQEAQRNFAVICVEPES